MGKLLLLKSRFGKKKKQCIKNYELNTIHKPYQPFPAMISLLAVPKMTKMTEICSLWIYKTGLRAVSNMQSSVFVYY